MSESRVRTSPIGKVHFFAAGAGEASLPLCRWPRSGDFSLFTFVCTHHAHSAVHTKRALQSNTCCDPCCCNGCAGGHRDAGLAGSSVSRCVSGQSDSGAEFEISLAQRERVDQAARRSRAYAKIGPKGGGGGRHSHSSFEAARLSSRRRPRTRSS